jgi:hypothetical protein
MVSVEHIASIFRAEYTVLLQKVEAAGSPERVVSIYQDIRRHIPQDVSQTQIYKWSFINWCSESYVLSQIVVSVTK